MRSRITPTPPAKAQALRALGYALGLSLLGHAGLLLLNSTAEPAPDAGAGKAKHSPQLIASMQTRPAAAPEPAPEPARSKPTASPTPAGRPAQQADQAGPAPEAHPPSDAAGSGAASPAPALSSLPSGEWHYQLSQFGREGRAVLRWDLQADGAYALSLERELGGRPLPGWRSQGRLEPQGLAPQRFVQTLRGRERAALNFRREEGLLSFSASDDLLPLEPGLQDRLSWWLQLAGLAQSQPERFAPGREITLRVAGLRGQPHDWIFEVLPLETSGAGPLLHLRRQALGEYSGEVHLWLDPARQHLPVRVLFQLPDERSWSLQLMPAPAGESSAPDSREAP
ncbi:hypothetical protein HNP55_001746 [Paucibacter oligotrophus]|uniref:DUF3108 domain-containing protein n=1 Tax=Roseateles oligotrophus TaxID=1769250 RepID=A0A840LD29_9BURK|nr:DUF3108 domain-containing protein [Roseateles oligotrophus]MBB4843227.1 hypothetical protein [Roseateles oligotrophus]